MPADLVPAGPQPPARAFELGLYSFAERTPDPATGQLVSPAQRLRDLIETIELADQVGLDVFGLGEHHRPDFVSSAPAVILAMAAARTKTIRLTSAVTVLSSDDPVRVFQAFATLDLLSGGRAEIMAGRGSFIESFPLFGYDLNDYDALFAEKLDLLLALRETERITWTGAHRPPLAGQGVYRARCKTRCPFGWPWAARRNRRCAPPDSGCPWRWPSLAAGRSNLCRWWSCIARPGSRRGSRRPSSR